MKRNLVYVSCLDDDGFGCNFGNKKCIIMYNENNVGLAIRQDKLYLISTNDAINNIVSTPDNKRKRNDNETSSKLWHYRLCHISRGRIERLIKENILHSLVFDDEKCIDCIKRKYHKKIKKGTNRSQGVLEIIHTNICGSFNVKSVDGFDLFITFTDDCSRFGYIYPMKERAKALDKFNLFKAEVENQHDRKITIVRSDRGGEYYGRHMPYGQIPGPFAKFLQKNGIKA